MTHKMTIREVRKVLFDIDKFAVIGTIEMSNKEARDFLYNREDQERLINVINKGSHLLVWGV